jgi:nicotinate-nucleotide--dimethylbenzimidazole phosphoribosyltransferase
VFCGDHGVVREGVAQSDSSVTARVARSIAEGTANVNLMAGAAGADVFAVDAGMAEDIDDPRMITIKQAHGTQNMAKGPAMSREECLAAILAGAELARDRAAAGDRLLAVGEMGIGNTTTAAAVAAVLLCRDPEGLTGRGAGLSDAGLERKKAAIRTAIARNRPDAEDVLDVLAKLGGLDIAGMCGAFLGAAASRTPVLIDGFISAVAALCALRLCPGTKTVLLASHVSAEPAGALLLRELGLEPLISAGMRLGEGSGAVAAMPLLDMALAVYQSGQSFARLGIEAYRPQ